MHIGTGGTLAGLRRNSKPRPIRDTASPAVAARIKAGRSIYDALMDIIGRRTPSNTARVLADLEDMGVWSPDR